ncbi:MAG: fused MFS/spermidine synthase [bacterium]
MIRRERWYVPAVWAAFFLSGAAGLVYEVVWARYLDLILGGTAYAHTMVLAAYMGGMALGAWFFGRLADRMRQPLVVYTYLELAIGLYGLFFPTLFTWGSSLYLTLAGPLGTTGTAGVLNKSLVSALLLMPPTFLMGGTLPLLTRAVTSLPKDVGRGVSGLYFINSLGAVIGTLLAGFLFIRVLGNAATVTTAAAINILVGAGLLAAWRFGYLGAGRIGPLDTHARQEGSETGEPVSEPPPGPDWPEDPARLVLWYRVAVWGAGISGLIVMVYEVSWIRLLSTILGSSTYSFTLMLAAFITGIALGSLAARRLARRERPFLYFGVAEVLMGLAMLAALPLYARLPFSFLHLQGVVARTPSGYAVYEILKYLFCLSIMLLPTLASGAALPLATDAAARLSRRVGGPVGRVYAVNTLGTIVGALAGGLILIPGLGVKLTIELAIAVNVLFGLGVLGLHPAVTRKRLKQAGALAAALAAFYLIFVPGWDQRALATGVFREHGVQGMTGDEYEARLQRYEVLYYQEDVNGTVAVLGDRTTGARSMVVNGKADASTYRADQATQTLIAAIPALMVPDAARALVVGLGSGQSAGHLLRYPVERVEVIEISPGVVEASRFFDHINGRPLEDPRTELVTQDAKTYLLNRPEARYDLILSEPSNPWIAGMGGLFSLEYFRALRDRLGPGGVAAQWIHTYEQTDETLTSVLVTFGEVFPYVTVWGTSRSDLLLVGSTRPVEWDFRASEELIRRSGAAEMLQRVGVGDLFTLLGRQRMSALRTAEATSLGGYLNTDNFPFLEYAAPRAFFLDATATLTSRFDERLKALRNTGLFIADYLAGRDPELEELESLTDYYRSLDLEGERVYRSAIRARMQRSTSERVRRSAVRAGLVQAQAARSEAEAMYHASPDSLAPARFYAEVLIEQYGQFRSFIHPARDLAEGLLDLLPGLAGRVDDREGTWYLYEAGKAAYDLGRVERAIELLERTVDRLGLAADPTELFRTLAPVLRSLEGGTMTPAMREDLLPVMDPRTPPAEVLTYLGRVLLEAGQAAPARERFRDAYRLDPGSLVAAFYLTELDESLTSGRFFR